MDRMETNLSEMRGAIKDLQINFTTPVNSLTNAVHTLNASQALGASQVVNAVGALTAKIDTLMSTHLKIIYWLLFLVSTALAGIETAKLFKGLSP